MNAAETIASAFAATLREWLSTDQWADMRARNVNHANDGICASHDYCDANMAMEAAFISVTGREASFGFDTNADGSPVNPADAIQADADCDLWNAAWDIAKPRYLTADPCDFTECASLNDMSEALTAFYDREGLEAACALEALMGMELTRAQSDYLSAFCIQWDALQTAADGDGQ